MSAIVWASGQIGLTCTDQKFSRVLCPIFLWFPTGYLAGLTIGTFYYNPMATLRLSDPLFVRDEEHPKFLDMHPL